MVAIQKNRTPGEPIPGRPLQHPEENARSVSLTVRVPPSIRKKLDAEYKRRMDIDSVSQLVTTILRDHFDKPSKPDDKK